MAKAKIKASAGLRNTIQFRLPNDLTEFLQKEAKERGETFSVTVRGILREVMKNKQATK